MKQLLARIKSNKEISRDFFEMKFQLPDAGNTPNPGQFLTLRCSDSTDPLLRRPFAFSAFNNNKIAAIIYQKRGKATENLSGLKADGEVDLIYPLGNCFPTPDSGKKPVLVSGGIGLGPMLYLYNELVQKSFAPLFIAGFRDSSLVPETGSFSPHAGGAVICTDDGSSGYSGSVIDYLKSLPPSQIKDAVFYTCGPYPMMKEVHLTALKSGCVCWTAMEQVMACGVGACMGCAIKVKGTPGFSRVCKEGPIYNSRVIEWT